MGNAEATLDRRFVHETVTETAAAYLYGICRNHPFVGGNKRTAVAASLVFLAINDVEIDAGEDEFYDLVIRVAERRVTKAEVAVFLQKSIRET
ncbi:MAG TPA: type II toxin-antitoxin system death-on-curing family toxin [Thermoanaerobaculia bacterium]|nr:type II toxin-antitoxin system death-on-curing family toxin [Thermoanaerobaculia bacterium]